MRSSGRRAVVLTCGVVMTVALATAAAQVPGFGGTWRLDDARSSIAPGAGLFGLIGSGIPATLHVTQPANGTLVVESQVNEGHARLYAPRGRTTTPAGQAGTITMQAKWSGRTLAADGTQESAAGTSTTTRTVTEMYTLSPDGSTLTVEVTVTSGAETVSSRLVYTRLASVGRCESWPTPCKRTP